MKSAQNSYKIVIILLALLLFTETYRITATPCCCPTLLTASGTISAPGYYCLANDINGQILITANNVTLDLNGYSITIGADRPLIALTSVSNTIIKNGRILNGSIGIESLSTTLNELQLENLVITGCSSYAIELLTNAKNIILNNILLDNCGGGINIGNDNETGNFITGLVIDNFTIMGITSLPGITLTACNSVLIKNGLLDTMANTGISLTNVNAAQINNVSINNISSSGINVTTGTGVQVNNVTISNSTSSTFPMLSATSLTSSSFINVIVSLGLVGMEFTEMVNSVLENCQVSNLGNSTTDTSYGFQITESTSVLFSNCIAQDITAESLSFGFQIADAASSLIQFCNCTAQNITSPSGIAYGFFQDGTTCSYDTCLVQSCSATIGTGFVLSGPDVLLTNCKAQNCTSTIDPLDKGGSGFSIKEASNNISLQYCQSCNNQGSGYSIKAPNAVVGNSIALNNSSYGFLTKSSNIYNYTAIGNNPNYSGPTVNK